MNYRMGAAKFLNLPALAVWVAIVRIARLLVLNCIIPPTLIPV